MRLILSENKDKLEKHPDNSRDVGKIRGHNTYFFFLTKIRGQKIKRKLVLCPLILKILPAKPIPLYQKLAQKATELRLLGMSYEQIAKSLKVNERTVRKACKYKGK